MEDTYSKIFTVYLPVVVALYYLSTFLLPPSNFPKNIPTIPFYVSFLGTYTPLDQQDIYNIYLREKLEKYGAVKIYFASRWNILVSKPEYLQQVFKDEDIFAKSGNHIKIPSSVLAAYTGDNIISAHGTTWKLYRDILTSAIQFPNLEPIAKNSERFVNLVEQNIAHHGSSLQIGDMVQRLALQNIGDSMLGLNLKLFEQTNPIIHSKLKLVKSQIFKPLFLNFPYLDTFPIPSRVKARKSVVEFRDYFCNLITSSHTQQSTSGTVSYKLVTALKEGKITEKQFHDNAMIVMIAGHENPQLLLSSLFYVLAKNPTVQETLRAKLQEPEVALDNIAYLNAVIYETLRMYPPLGQIINRCTTQDVLLGRNIRIPKGTYVGYNNFATGRDRTVWENADNFVPERWGTSVEEVSRNYSRAKSNATLPAFHGRKRACLGERFALFETKQCLQKLLKSYRLELDANWVDKITPGGPVSPRLLSIKFTEIT
ncbi:cytochrome P450-dit2 [Yamadazyma tenuis]|uniref:Cytochrome P450 n=1 Tax=Candida tenuis (strain ATCC 10573 / BCRC 21748 / CBS 615 / JCM 9827 / NBRC 10315 / NRRL Y-1498 / VKM Y-70) TaxID=590646 RepID=G3AW34_CANTC|nr:cytochrome P450 [Yamadazyma tenuis ATCC 10573]EGV66438.1 cytochrome P450 [Yamadazyma tenuis ATCC 10573]WEJ95442.1 cytochrome P450-dit2 [Yamadazyma tenuis]